MPTRTKRTALTAAVSLIALSTLTLSITSANATVHHKHYTYSRSSAFDRSERTLMSRGGGFNRPAGATITGCEGIVLNDNAPIYASRENNGVLLSRETKNSQILVTGQAGDYWAVAMNNGSIGFIAKSDAKLEDIEFNITQPDTTQAQNAVYNPAPPQDVSPLIQNILASANNYKGIAPYLWGGNTMNGIDCSGFVKAVYGQNGITLPRTAAEQATVGMDVSLRDLSQWMPGDRMYFRCHHGYIDHTGMYIGNGFFIHSSIDHHGVEVDPVVSPFYWQHLVAVRRSTEVAASMNAQVGAATPDFESNQE